MEFAIIGAGIAGLSCADALAAAGHAVTLFDKGRRPGGRMSSRRLQTSLGEVMVDHGAQYFTVRDPGFQELVGTWSDLGTAARWSDAGADAWVGVPTMSAIIKRMADEHTVAWGHLVKGATRRNHRWWLAHEAGEVGPFDGVILAIPAEQAAPIAALHDLSMARSALLARSQPCWTGMFVFDRRLDSLPSIIRNSGDIAWAARNNAKPGRSGPEAWVVQASASWSNANLESSADEVVDHLLGALAEGAGAAFRPPISASAHRWRYALSAGTGEGAFWNAPLCLGICGDWLLGPRVECGWLSGRQLARLCTFSNRHPTSPDAARAAAANRQEAGSETAG